MAAGEGDIDGRPDLGALLDEIKALRARLESRAPVDTDAVDADLQQLAARLRASEQKLRARKPLDIRREG